MIVMHTGAPLFVAKPPAHGASFARSHAVHTWVRVEGGRSKHAACGGNSEDERNLVQRERTVRHGVVQRSPETS